MTRRKQYLAGVSLIAPLWFVLSFVLMMSLIDAEDPGLPIGEIAAYVDGQEIVSFDPNYKGQHRGEFPPVPLSLKVAFGVAYPMYYLLPTNGFPGLSDHAGAMLVLFMMAANSIVWGFVLVFLFRFVARRSRRRREIPNTV